MGNLGPPDDNDEELVQIEQNDTLVDLDDQSDQYKQMKEDL